MTTLTYRPEWSTGAAKPGRAPAVGDTVRVEAWGKSTGARLVDVGRTGTVVAVRRTHVLVELAAGNGEPAGQAAMWPACLSPTRARHAAPQVAACTD